MVGKEGFEPSTSTSRTLRASQAALLPENFNGPEVNNKYQRVIVAFSFQPVNILSTSRVYLYPYTRLKASMRSGSDSLFGVFDDLAHHGHGLDRIPAGGRFPGKHDIIRTVKNGIRHIADLCPGRA